MGIGDLVAEHGSPLWLVNLDILRDRWRTCAAVWRSSWPVVQIAYSYKANRQAAILRALAAEGAGHEVDSEIEHDFAAYRQWNPFMPRLDGEVRVGARLRRALWSPARRRSGRGCALHGSIPGASCAGWGGARSSAASGR